MAKLASLLGNHYTREGDHWILRDDTEHTELSKKEEFCWFGWKERFYRDFIEPLDGDVRASLVDYHI
jgi:hypothetical protein